MYDQSKLSELIRFARVDAGSTVIDVYPGDGDWTRLFSDIVGPQGRVYSFVPAEVAHFKNDPVGRMRTLAKEPGRENVEAVSADLVAMPEATQPADVLWLHLFYHDLHTALIQAKGATAGHFNRAVYERLKPGGCYVIVDHAAAAGAGTSNAQSLHRIEPASVREEVEAAGFVLDAESTMLRADSRRYVASAAFAAIVAWAHQTSSSKADFVAASRLASMSSMGLFGEVDMKSVPGPVMVSRTDRRSDRSRP